MPKIKFIEYGEDRYVAIFKIKGKIKKNPLIFAGHTDTVPPGTKWNTNPFKAVMKNGKIYGLGASDMKSGVAVMIKLAMKIKNPKNDVYFIFTGDEETKSLGCENVVKYLRGIKSGKVILLEPTNGDIEYGQKATIQYTIEVFGKARHSSLTNYKNNQRNNAIVKAIKILSILNDFDRQLDKKKYGIYGKLTQNIGVISGGTASNVVPDMCIINVNYRLPPEMSMKKLDKMIRKKIKNARVTSGKPHDFFETSKNSEFVKKFHMLTKKEFQKNKFMVTFGWTEAGLLKKLGECLVFGPGDKKCIHSSNEFVKSENLDKCFRVLMKLADDNERSP